MSSSKISHSLVSISKLGSHTLVSHALIVRWSTWSIFASSPCVIPIPVRNCFKFSANLIKMVADKHKNFMEIVNSVLAKNYTLDDWLKKYKRRYVNNKIISSTTVLYRSNAFSSTLGIIEDNENKPQIDTTQKIGRNDPCPCGSGKKYKKCCGMNE